MRLTTLTVKQFRCFNSLTITFDTPIALLYGPNGSGKSSLVEALHYCCYLRSFRTHIPRELIKFGSDGFFIQLSLQGDEETHTLSTGFSQNRRKITLDGQQIDNYKQLHSMYRSIVISEHDIFLVTGAPEVRRAFIDEIIFLHNPDYVSLVRRYKHALAQRNAALFQRALPATIRIWTEKVWEYGVQIQKERISALEQLSENVAAVLVFYGLTRDAFTLHYKKKCDLEAFESFDEFLTRKGESIEVREREIGRTLFGPHLDDLEFLWNGIEMRSFASRGQQKRALFILKTAIIKGSVQEPRPYLILDDFFADFDDEQTNRLFDLLVDLNVSLLFTTPRLNTELEQRIIRMGGGVRTIS